MKHSLGGMLCASTLVLSACASTDYGPIDPAQNRIYGYSERMQDDGIFILEAVGTKPDMAREFWMKRVEELCPDGDAETNIFAADYAGAPNMFGSEPLALGAVMKGTVSCKGLDKYGSKSEADLVSETSLED
ncbi:MAG: hypothetical protein AAGH90_06365 [Pseudomonadota bacterium]